MTGIRHGVGHTPIIHYKNPAKVQQQATPVKPEPAPKPIDLKTLSESSEHLLDGINQGPTAPIVAGATTKGSGVNPHDRLQDAPRAEGVDTSAIKPAPFLGLARGEGKVTLPGDSVSIDTRPPSEIKPPEYTPSDHEVTEQGVTRTYRY